MYFLNRLKIYNKKTYFHHEACSKFKQKLLNNKPSKISAVVPRKFKSDVFYNKIILLKFENAYGLTKLK